MKPGDKIPSERELCEMMSISRIAVREAIKGLVARNLLEVRTGEGTYVKSITPEELFDPLTARLLNEYTLKELLEFRRVIEVAITGFAAIRAKESDIQSMKEILEQMKRDLRENNDYLEPDVAFHNAIAQASGNKLLTLVMNQVGDLIREAIRETSQVPGAPQRAFQLHHDIYEKIRLKDSIGAKEAMFRHLREVEEGLLKYQERKKLDSNE